VKRYNHKDGKLWTTNSGGDGGTTASNFKVEVGLPRWRMEFSHFGLEITVTSTVKDRDNAIVDGLSNVLKSLRWEFIGHVGLQSIVRVK
jgi:hypothetical protein